MRNDEIKAAKKLTLKKETLRDLRLKTGVKTGLSGSGVTVNCTTKGTQNSAVTSCASCNVSSI
jgi:hypothetical protein